MDPIRKFDSPHNLHKSIYNCFVSKVTKAGRYEILELLRLFSKQNPDISAVDVGVSFYFFCAGLSAYSKS